MPITLKDLRAHHLDEAARHLAIARNWTAAAENEARASRLHGRANSVRHDKFADSAREALALAQQHTAFAELAVSAMLSHAPITLTAA